MKNIEERPDGLTYYKNTSELVDGKVVRKFDNGTLAETASYKNGKQVGKWYTYGYKGEDITHGYIISIDKEIISGNKSLSLSNSTLSINFEVDYKYASLAIPSNSVEPSTFDLLILRNIIFNKLKNKEPIKNIFISYKEKEYRFEKENYFKPLSYDTLKTDNGMILKVR